MTEQWRDIPEYEGYYQASNLGNIRSLGAAQLEGKVLKPYVSRHNGYCYVSLSKNNKAVTKRVHRLVALAWIPREVGKDQLNHIDGDKTNNRVDNLEWCNASENMVHAYGHNLINLPKKAVIDLDTLVVYRSLTEATKEVFGGGRGEMIARVCAGKRSHYKNRHFAFYEDYMNGTIPAFSGKYQRGASKTLWVNHQETKDIGAN